MHIHNQEAYSKLMMQLNNGRRNTFKTIVHTSEYQGTAFAIYCKSKSFVYALLELFVRLKHSNLNFRNFQSSQLETKASWGAEKNDLP